MVEIDGEGRKLLVAAEGQSPEKRTPHWEQVENGPRYLASILVAVGLSSQQMEAIRKM